MRLFFKKCWQPKTKKSYSQRELHECIDRYSKLIQDFNDEVNTEVLEPLSRKESYINEYIERLKQSQDPPTTEQVIVFLESIRGAGREYTNLERWMAYLMHEKAKIELDYIKSQSWIFQKLGLKK